MNPMATTNQKPTTNTWKLEEQEYTTKENPQITRDAWLLCSTWDLSSLTRDRTHIPCNARQILNYCHSGSSGKRKFKKFIYNSIKNKILRNEFNEVKNLKYTQIYLKDIKDLKKWKGKSCSWMRKLILLWQQQLPNWLTDLIQLLSESEKCFPCRN